MRWWDGVTNENGPEFEPAPGDDEGQELTVPQS